MSAQLTNLVLSLAARDRQAAEQILRRGDLEDMYHPELEEIHKANAKALEAIIDEHGLPGISAVGAEGAEAVWLIIQHAISVPQFQRKCLLLLQQAALDGEFPPGYAAYLEDRIRVHEGRPQKFGTQFDWNEEGRLVPYSIEEPLRVNELRRSVGLNTMEEMVTKMRRTATRPPADYDKKKREYEKWLISVGWRA